MRLVVTNTKGGAGKSTTAMYLAEAAQREGLDVEVWDADPQGTAITWSDEAHDNGQPLSFPVVGIHPKSVSSKQKQGRITIVDTGPGDPGTINAAVNAADFVVIPTGPGGAEVERALSTYNSVRAAAPTAILLTKFRKIETDSLETWRTFQSSDLPIFDTRIPRRVGIERSFGHAISGDLYQYDRLLTEIRIAYDQTSERTA